MVAARKLSLNLPTEKFIYVNKNHTNYILQKASLNLAGFFTLLQLYANICGFIIILVKNQLKTRI